jgi:hypothetical protein
MKHPYNEGSSSIFAHNDGDLNKINFRSDMDGKGETCGQNFHTPY